MEPTLLVSCSVCHGLHAPGDELSFEPMCAGCAVAHPFRELDMRGSFPLTHTAIDDALTEKSPGNFALGYQDGASFLVFYVGRSDSDVRARLHAWVGTPSRCARDAPASAPWSAERAPRCMPAAALAIAPAGRTGTGYTRFAYSYAETADAAFAKQCRNYDDFGGARELDNAAHPAAPEGPGWGAPREFLGVGRLRIARPFPRPKRGNPLD
jgi:hypothetical protein